MLKAGFKKFANVFLRFWNHCGSQQSLKLIPNLLENLRYIIGI